jgi:uncharacterized pyridoxal phosphate-containing UPF0001 family protein
MKTVNSTAGNTQAANKSGRTKTHYPIQCEIAVMSSKDRVRKSIRPHLGEPKTAETTLNSHVKLLTELQLKAYLTSKYSSMGVSYCNQIALEKGAGIVLIGTKLFGEWE